MRGSYRMHLILLLATAFAVPTLADTDPSLSQVHEAVRTGHLEQAQKMMNQVLHDHPKSAKAHYVAAEVNAASGHFVQGRQELRLAQELAPSLPFASPKSVRELQGTLSQTPLVHPTPARQTAAEFPWSALAVIVIGVGVVLALVLMSRRAPIDSSEVGQPPAAGSPATAVAAGVPPSAGTGIGPSIAGDLAGGLAAGAGIVAGEEIARHLLNTGQHDVNSPPADHLGGPDFGVSGASLWDEDEQSYRGDDWT